ncbi:hypothetical protein [Hirschia baltica]|uniref:Uncharacterized protein n=1 Tax=Hirschia baltica (strain ATCC 49814 / DSM 5838 / IFAM 1418) TaxID=582402 RepID=C6XKI7_HIRBI|nr:hypothetical protein [Hirschia baltica]ACT59554.1 hypothetical protein Hbal_1868 [Hirschia baltica ATCC 49814]
MSKIRFTLEHLKPHLTTSFLICFAFLLSYASAHFVALQSSQISAKQEIETDAVLLNAALEKTDADLQDLIEWIDSQVQMQRYPAEKLYFLADSERNRITGNLKAWPEHAQPYNGWHQFNGSETGITIGPSYARVSSINIDETTKPYKLLIGRQTPSTPFVFQKIWPVFLSLALIFGICGGFIFQAQKPNKD